MTTAPLRVPHSPQQAAPPREPIQFPANLAAPEPLPFRAARKQSRDNSFLAALIDSTEKLSSPKTAAASVTLADSDEQRRSQDEARIRRDAAEERRRQDAEKQSRLGALIQQRLLEDQRRQEEEARKRRQAEEQARLEAEEQARQAEEEQMRAEAEELRLRLEEEQNRRQAEDLQRRFQGELERLALEQARRDAQEKARQEAELNQARFENEERARLAAVEAKRIEAEETARLEAENVRRDEEDKAEREAEERFHAAMERVRRAAEERRVREIQESGTDVEEPHFVQPPALQIEEDETPATTVMLKRRPTTMSGPLQRAWSWLNRKYAPAKQLRVAETVSLGDKRFVAVVQVEGRKFLIGGGSAGVALLTQLGEAAATENNILAAAKCSGSLG